MTKQLLGTVGALIVLVIATTMLAEAAQPGDLLYAYKTQINERISGWLAIEYVADVSHQVDLLEERLAEIDALVAAGELTPELAADLRANFFAQLETTQRTLTNASGRALTPVQIATLNDSLERVKQALMTYSKTLSQLDAVVEVTPPKSTLKLNRKNSHNKTSDAIAEAFMPLEVEIAEAIEELDAAYDDAATVTNDDAESEVDSEVTEVIESGAEASDDSEVAGVEVSEETVVPVEPTDDQVGETEIEDAAVETEGTDETVPEVTS